MPAPTARRRTRVVVMFDSLQRPGGAERLALEGAIRLDPTEYERWVCLTRWEERFERDEPARSLLARLSDAGVGVIRLRRNHRFALWAWWPLLRLLRSKRVDVLHAHLFGSNLWGSVLGRLIGVPAIVAHEHMWAYSGDGARSVLDREVIGRFADAFIAVSLEGRRRMIETEGVAASSVVYIPNGVASVPDGDGRAVRSELGIPLEAPLIGSVGHLRTEKAFEVLIEAAAGLRDRFPEARVLIAGEGPERERLEAMRGRLGLDSVVLMPGARDDVPDVLAALDVAVCCSDFEGGPLSVMEYMGAGVPVVATRVGGLPELIRDGETGLLVEPREPRQLADAVCRLLERPALSEDLAASARDLRAREYDVDVWVGRIADLYQSLLGRARARGGRRKPA